MRSVFDADSEIGSRVTDVTEQKKRLEWPSPSHSGEIDRIQPESTCKTSAPLA